MNYTTPANLADVYKVGHRSMYPEGMTGLQSNWTPRGSRVPNVTDVVFFGLQAFLQRYLVDYFHDKFFGVPVEQAVGRHQARVESILGQPFNVDHWRALHALGYLPLRFSALPEGTEVPLRVPCYLVENTHPDFAWLVNYIESVMSAEVWKPMTSATTALHLRRLLDAWAQLTSTTPAFVDWQGHDFSFRGMGGLDDASASGAGHLLCFAGSDSIPAMDWTDTYYSEDPSKVRFVGGSVPATEHSVMCAGGQEGEAETILRLLDKHPTGILSVVSDTWDLWKVLTETLRRPDVYAKIMAREGKFVVRPDSGDPADILCGDPSPTAGFAESKGVVELLWDTFGGTVNAKGYKVLDAHIGTIYGDAITYDRAGEICSRLEAKGFASTNIVLGVGSFTYQYVTRDTFSMAMKATWCAVNGEGRAMSKAPVTDRSGKKSARGRLAALRDAHGHLYLVENATPEQEAASCYTPVWENGAFLKRWTFREIAQRVGKRHLLPE